VTLLATYAHTVFTCQAQPKASTMQGTEDMRQHAARPLGRITHPNSSHHPPDAAMAPRHLLNLQLCCHFLPPASVPHHCLHPQDRHTAGQLHRHLLR
jgi:hypothetical protein